MGNYDPDYFGINPDLVIPLREKMGNYDNLVLICMIIQLYHYERKWGTTTHGAVFHWEHGLYHCERKWGTGNYDNVSAPNIP